MSSLELDLEVWLPLYSPADLPDWLEASIEDMSLVVPSVLRERSTLCIWGALTIGLLGTWPRGKFLVVSKLMTYLCTKCSH